MKVSLEDCALSVSAVPNTRRLDSEFELHLTLPRMLDLTRIPPFKRWNGGHELHIGSSGILYLACDYKARFWTWEYLSDTSEDSDCRNYEFQSLSVGMGYRRFRSFKLDELDWLLKGLHEKEKPEIIAGINSYDNLALYMQRFFDWVNEFVGIYGERRFYEPLDTGPFRNGYYDSLPSHPMHRRVIAVPAEYLAQNINF